MVSTFDFLVVGGGIGGVSVAHELSAHGSVCLIEQETQLAYHTTGRSAAISMESYGNEVIRALTTVSSLFLKNPPEGFAEFPLWSPRGAMILADREMEAKLDARIAAVSQLIPTARRLSSDEIMGLAPFLRRERWVAALYEPDAFDLDVHGIHNAFLRGLRRRGGVVRTGIALVEAVHRRGSWQVTVTGGERIATGAIVNASGAWADTVASLCGVPVVGLRPLRRTVIHVDPKFDLRNTPYIGTVDEQIFIKPESGGLIVSPCDEQASEPCDAWAEEIDVAITVERLEQATSLSIPHIGAKWAGLRSFVPDRSPVVGADADAEGFFWLAALGGYGIQTAPAMARLCCAMVLGARVPEPLARRGITAEALAPSRCRSTEFAQRTVKAVAELA